jgi:hypothetical protein
MYASAYILGIVKEGSLMMRTTPRLLGLTLIAAVTLCGSGHGPAAAAEADPCLTPLLEDEPLCNPAVAQSEWPISHRGSYAQASSPFPGPVPGQTVSAAHLDLPGPPITLAMSPPYGDSGHAIWGAVLGLTGAVVKIDADTFTLIDTYVPAAEEASPPVIPLGVSGAYSVTDPDGHFLLGRATFVEMYGDATPGDRSSDIALIKRVFLPSTAFCRSSDLLVGGVMLPDRHLALVTAQAVVSVIPAAEALMDAANVVSLPSENGADCANGAIPDKDLETVSNSIAADEHGGIYVVTDAAVIKYQWDGTSLSKVWRTDYDSDPPFSVLRLGPGSGSTPTLMGTDADDDRFVVITDGQQLMHLVLMWRDDVPAGWQPIAPGKDPRIACEVPVTFGDPLATRSLSEQSVLVRGYASVVVSNLLGAEPAPSGFSAIDTAIAALWGSNDLVAPRGIERIDWDPVTRTCAVRWVNDEVSLPNAIPTMSAATGLIHAIGQRGGVWGLETLDLDSGASVMFNPSAQTVCSQAVRDAITGSILGLFLDPTLNSFPQSCENSFFAATEVGPNGAIYTGTFQGVSRFLPDAVATVSRKRQAAAGADQGREAASRGGAALPTDVAQARDMAKRGQTQLDAALAALAAGTGTDVDVGSAAQASALMTSARAHFASAEAALDVDLDLAAGEFDAARTDAAAAYDFLHLCPPAPQSDCRAPAKAVIAVKNSDPPTKSTLKWIWKSETPGASVPDPLDNATYALCAYDAGGADRVLDAPIPTSPLLWKAIGGGFKYRDKLTASAGVKVALLKEKSNGAIAKVIGKGANVPVVPIPVTTPLRVQLVNSETGECWDAVFDGDGIKKNEGGKLVAKFKAPN